jgi:hypothetical protein
LSLLIILLLAVVVSIVLMRASMRRRQRMLEEERKEREQAVERGELGPIGDPFGALLGGLFGPLLGGIETRSYRFDPATGRWVEMTDELLEQQPSPSEELPTEARPKRGRKSRSATTQPESPFGGLFGESL